MVLDNSFHDPEPQSGAFFSLSCNKRLKDCANHLGGNPAAGIGYENPHPAVQIIGTWDGARTDDQPAPVGHGVLGVNDQVGKHLPDLIGGDYSVRKGPKI